MKFKFYYFYILIFSLFFISCNSKYDDDKIFLNDGWSYSLVGPTIGFKPIDTKDFNHLKKFVPDGKGYIWLKTSFNVPVHMQGKSLSIYLGITKIADISYLNSTYIGKSGFFPPNEFTSGEITSVYPIPSVLLNYHDENTLVIKLWVNGYGQISQNPFISSSDYCNVLKIKNDYLNSKLHLIVSFILIIVSSIYFLLYILRPKEHANISFARLTFFSALFLTTVSVGEYSVTFNGMNSFLLFEKIFHGIIAILTGNFAVSFIRDFLHKEDTKSISIIRKILLIISILVLLPARDLTSFFITLKIAYVLMSLHICTVFFHFIPAILEKDKRIVILISGFSPVLLSLLISLFEFFITKTGYTLLTIVVGWQLTILSFLGILVYDFAKSQNEVEYLNKNLENLVNERTNELSKTNIKLAETNSRLNYEIDRAEKEIELASYVQQSFFTHEIPQVDDWDISFYSKAVAGVSGDLYDFYMKEGHMHGLGIFDISGHGIASGLVTMLVKNIIQQEFFEGTDKKLEDVISVINERVVSEKGNIENYLTGILCRTFDKSIEFVNAGHPHPYLYSKKTGTISIIDNHSTTRCGVIGIRGLPCKFESLTQPMESGDEVLFFTDGIIEAINENRVPFGKQSLVASFEKSLSEPLDKQIDFILKELLDYIGNQKINDDVTLLILKKK